MEVKEDYELLADRKIADWKTVKRRTGGFHVILTNGCFDILHPGHVAKLERARAIAGKHGLVVVAIDEDVDVRHKGPNRPVMPWQDRARIVAGLSSVDFVTSITSEPCWDRPAGTFCDLAQLILYLRPEVWAARPDLPDHELAAAAAAGTKVARIPRWGDYASTEIADRA